MEPLISVGDPDWAAYQSGDDSYLLRAAGESIRRYCGWHIWPSITVTVKQLKAGSAGLVMLPSLYVTDVSEVVAGEDVLEPQDYQWFRDGYIQLPVQSSWNPNYYGYVPGGYIPSTVQGLPVEVTMTHGYAEVPLEIKQVAFELASTASDIPSGSATEIQTPGFRLKLGDGAGGLSLNCGQMSRLDSFKLSWAL